MSQRTLTLVVVGLMQEARIAAGAGIVAIASGGDGPGFSRKLAALDEREIAAVVSFGLAGGLDPSLTVGNVVVANEILGPHGERLAASLVLADRLCARLAASDQATIRARIAGVEAPVMMAADKASLANRTGAAAVDMESHRAAAFALAHDIPFAALRVISDSAGRTLPPVAGRAMRPDGSVDVARVIRELLSDLSQLPPLARTALDAGTAFRRLRRVRGLLGPGFGLHL